MAEVLKCFIEVEDEWIQEGCHWKTDKVIIFTYKIPDTYSDSSKLFYYRLSESDSFTLIDSEVKQLNSTTYCYELKLSSLLADDFLLNKLNDNSLKIGSKIEINNRTISAEASFDYYYTLPPKSENLQVALNRKSADHIVCSWNSPEDLPDNNPSLAGYCVELFCKKKGKDSFTQIKNLSFSADYKLIENTINNDPVSEELNEGITTYVGLGSSLEAYIKDPNQLEFYFRPRDFSIEKDDFFMIKVYPYIVYGCYLDLKTGQPCLKHSGLLTSVTEELGGNSSEVMKFTLGTVRVKTTDSWVEGQVWVCVADETSPTGVKWKEADSIYTKTTDGWKESIS